MVRTLLALVVCLPLTAWAEGEGKPKEDPEDSETTPAATAIPPQTNKDSKLTLNPEGKYQGVAPGSEALPPHPPRMPIKRGLQRLTWSGFQVKEGVPTVFLQLTAVPDYKIDHSRGELVVTLRNTSINLRNNRRPLRVEAFDTQVRDVEAKSKGRDTRVTIRTKDAGNPTHKERVEAAAGGFQFLVIELPK
jgi:hypothetical protein